MNLVLIILVLIPVLVIASGLSISPLPLRVNATDPADRRAQHCLRISFFLVAIPVAVMVLIFIFMVQRFSGGPGLDAHKSLSYGKYRRLPECCPVSAGLFMQNGVATHRDACDAAFPRRSCSCNVIDD